MLMLLGLELSSAIPEAFGEMAPVFAVALVTMLLAVVVADDGAHRRKFAHRPAG
ncbi:MAG: hypothetical protein JJE50_13220 [Actinomycetales bacterium]|nr:hypothetical protein [Actinomycetales bacterium]